MPTRQPTDTLIAKPTLAGTKYSERTPVNTVAPVDETLATPTPGPTIFIVDETSVTYVNGVVSGSVVNMGSLGNLVMELYDPGGGAKFPAFDTIRELSRGETYVFRSDVMGLPRGTAYVDLEIHPINQATSETLPLQFLSFMWPKQLV